MNKIYISIAVTTIFMLQSSLPAQQTIPHRNESKELRELQFNGIGPNSFMGISVSNAGDVNGDGYDDIIVGSAQDGPGHSYVYYGGTNMNSDPDVSMSNQRPNDNFGISVSSAGDVNGDGYADVLIGTNSDRAYLFLGGQNMDSVVDITFTYPGPFVTNGFGQTVSGAGDVNGDGYSDILIGAPSTDNLTGSVYIYILEDRLWIIYRMSFFTVKDLVFLA